MQEEGVKEVMPAEEEEEELCRLRERLQRCAADLRRQQELLQTLHKEQEELQVATEQYRSEIHLTASTLESSYQQLQKLKGWMAETQEEQFWRKQSRRRAMQKLFKWNPWSEMGKAIEEHIEAKKLLEDKIQEQLELDESLQEQPACPEPSDYPSREKAAAAKRKAAEGSLLEEMVAVQLEEQLASRRHSITSWMRRFLLFLTFLQIILLVVVLLDRDVLYLVLPPKMAVAFGSHPLRPHFF